jgi:hypothetical protein
VGVTDRREFFFSWFRRVGEKIGVCDEAGSLLDYFRGIVSEAGSTGETRHGADYCRKNFETVKAVGIVFRGLLLFVRILTGVFARDYILSRFLKAQEELKLKSCICQEIILDSKIN